MRKSQSEHLRSSGESYNVHFTSDEFSGTHDGGGGAATENSAIDNKLDQIIAGVPQRPSTPRFDAHRTSFETIVVPQKLQ